MEIGERAAYVTRAFRQLQAEGRVKTQGDFAQLLGVSQNTISAAKNGDERYLTRSLIEKIEMLLGKPSEVGNTESIPVIPTEAIAGTLGEFADSVHAYECERMISPIKGADYAIKVCGDSMTPEIPMAVRSSSRKYMRRSLWNGARSFAWTPGMGRSSRGSIPQKTRRWWSADPQIRTILPFGSMSRASMDGTGF